MADSRNCYKSTCWLCEPASEKLYYVGGNTAAEAHNDAIVSECARVEHCLMRCLMTVAVASTAVG